MPNSPAYDLLVLIDADAPEERRGQILDAIRKQIDSGDGELKADVDWGVRKLAFEIDHRGDAYYHLFQLEALPELLNQLEHSLAIDDAVLRHRIIRLTKGVPDRPPRPSPSTPRPAPATGEEGSPPAAAPTEETAIPPAAAPTEATAIPEAAAPTEDTAIPPAAAPTEETAIPEAEVQPESSETLEPATAPAATESADGAEAPPQQ